MPPTPAHVIPAAATRDPRRGLTSLVALVVVLLGLGAVSAPPSAARPDASGSPRAKADEISLFPERAPRRVTKDRDRRPVEVGTRFQSSTAGSVTGVQVYKIADAKGATPRRASLWSPRGTRLAKARITPLEGRGWVSVRFDAPVTIQADRTYTVSVFAPRGRPAVTKRGLRKAKTSGSLSTGGKHVGVYRHGSKPKAPTRSRHKSNYWVDVTFAPGEQTELPPPPPPPPSEDAFPTQATTGVPVGWTPARVVNGTYRISTPGAVVEDLQVNGSIEVAAPNVTLRRVEVVGGSIDNFAGPTCQPGLLVENSTIRKGGATSASDSPALQAGGYTARGVQIDGLAEGFRVGGRTSGCGPVTIEGSWARVVRPDTCGDWHGDGIQGYGGPALTVRRTTLILEEDGCGGTAPFFYPLGQDNTSVDIDGLLVSGGGYPFRLGTPGTVKNLAVLDNSWHYGPINVKCSVLTSWQASVVTVADNGVATPVRPLPCTMEQGQ
ncbi:DUF4082 domain-containing protein [Nocardioides hwasunensis]|uniref:DUF4082 domain-containing protein n=1 Tax=Nocardioides hwasunensis TaxID=397258 RepID=A0ABR8MGM0_9ACTN|nr:DUF4082 domain-containing protein [Nocardioides hwasunensis]MBD3915223.1 DUF4082 domain-containing protein [Nocardioides hwasunensis]